MSELRPTCEIGGIARDLHDGVIQDLCYLRFRAQGLVARVEDAAARQEALLLVEQTEVALQSVRQVIANHQPFGATEDLALCVQHFAQRIGRESGLRVSLLNQIGSTVSATCQHHVYRIVQEALRNAVRHAGATAVRIRLKTSGKRLGLRIVDNGIGLSSQAHLPPHHVGLGSMRYRAQALGGDLLVWSRRNMGTVVQAVVPRCV